MLKVAILDDYQDVSQEFVDLKKLSGKYEFKIFSEPFIDEADALNQLADFEALLIMRERTLITKNLINNQKTALDIFISNDTFNQYPNLIVVGGTPRGDISSGEFKTKVLNEFSEQSINKITNDELMNAKARIKANNVYKFDSVFYQAMQVGMMETKDISWENLDNYSSIMESMTLEEVKSAGEIYFSNDQLLTTVLRPKK